MTVRFSEKQVLISPRWTAIILMAILGMALLQYYFTRHHDGTMNLIILVMIYSPFVFIIVWFYYGKMELTIEDSELRIVMWRFSKNIPLRSIHGCRIIDIHMMRDFGGFGYRPGLLGKEHVEGYVYPKQPRGVIFSYVGGENDIVISSTRPEDLFDAMCIDR